MNEKAHHRLMTILIGVKIVPIFALLFIIAGLSFKEGDWPYGVMMLAIMPAVAMGFAVEHWTRARGFLDAEGLEGAERHRARFRKVFSQVSPLVVLYAFVGLKEEMTVSQAFASVGESMVTLSIAFGLVFLLFDRVVFRTARRQ